MAIHAGPGQGEAFDQMFKTDDTKLLKLNHHVFPGPMKNPQLTIETASEMQECSTADL